MVTDHEDLTRLQLQVEETFQEKLNAIAEPLDELQADFEARIRKLEKRDTELLELMLDLQTRFGKIMQDLARYIVNKHSGKGGDDESVW